MLLTSVVLVGTLGYMVIEGWSLAEAMYMTLITLSTVGYGEVYPLTAAGRIFTSLLIIGGVVFVGYVFSVISQSIVSGELTGSLGRRRMQNAVDQLRDHFIICGMGRVGRQVAYDLAHRGEQCVVVESTAETPRQLTGQLIVVGDAEDDNVLMRAGIKRARGLVATMGDDPTNMFVTVSARALNPDCFIIARANFVASEAKLLRAGADQVVSPYLLSGRRMATMLVTPTLTRFLDEVAFGGVGDLHLEEYELTEVHELQDHPFDPENVRDATGANILAVRGEDGHLTTTFGKDAAVAPGDTLVAMGTASQLTKLRELAGVSATAEATGRFRRVTSPGAPAEAPGPIE